MPLLDSNIGNLIVGLASLRQPGLLGQIQNQQRQTGLDTRQAEEDKRRRTMEDFKFKQMQGQAQSRKDVSGSLLGQLPPTRGNLLASDLYAAGDKEAALKMSGLLSQPQQKPTSLMQNVEAMNLTPGTPEYIQAIRQGVFTPKTQIDLGNKAIPLNQINNLMMPDGGSVPIGTTMEQAGKLGVEFKKKPVAAESAGKQAMIDTAIAQNDIVEKLIFPQGLNGPVDTDVVTGMAIKSQLPGFMQPLTAGVSEKGQQAAAGMEVGIQAVTRIETGAAMQKSEIGNTRRRFQPMPWDHDTVKKQKWIAYKLFTESASKYFNPNIQKGSLTDKQVIAETNAAIDKALTDATKMQQKQTRPPLASFQR